MLARAALTATALLAFAQNPGAHGNIKEPKATFTNGAPIVQWVMIDNFWVIGIGGDQVGKFKTMAKEKGMGFNDVVLDMVKDKKWGYTSTDVDSQPVPSDGKVKWLANGGGACELYIDDKMVPHGDDSEEEFPGGLDGPSKMSELSVDFTSCHREAITAGRRRKTRLPGAARAGDAFSGCNRPPPPSKTLRFSEPYKTYVTAYQKKCP
ncbi:hypothetical protein PC119_g14286 [Phytophthora cactorum]|uniref:Concanavalin A-like lectin/glucanase domain n=1 Tax=Phytophthora cactorum TaxID=29920 RepID=A0A8T0YXZ1_9STRA|nr:hypothetical protein PC113_g13220 [Phytophthora cactorum]KAG2897719.1 hypothetical protein PC114_g14560 [Phytophthora cactorum]KAG3008271.1 hypothetical protein PC119_g14286 [Phytophthora cactorum]KAG3156335.1 hypothetical protein C6341_g15101 [Phytophthora cactorum]